MQAICYSILGNLASSGILFTIGYFLINKWIDSAVTRSLTVQQAELEQGHRKELAIIQANLDRLNSQSGVSFSAIYVKRLDILEDIFRKIIDFSGAIHEMSGDYPNLAKEKKAELNKNYNDTFNALKNLWIYNRFYLTDKISEKVENLLLSAHQSINIISINEDSILRYAKIGNFNAVDKAVDKSEEYKEILANVIPELVKEIEKEIKLILHIDQ